MRHLRMLQLPRSGRGGLRRMRLGSCPLSRVGWMTHPRWRCTSADDDAHDDDAEASRSEPSASGQVVASSPIINQLHAQARAPTPAEVTVFPLYQRPVFPGVLNTALVKNDAFMKTLRTQTLKGNRFVGLFQVKDEASEVKGAYKDAPDVITSLDQIHRVGILGALVDLSGAHGAMRQIAVSGIRRIVATDAVPDKPFLTVQVEDLHHEPFDRNDDIIRAYSQEIMRALRDIAALDPLYKDQVVNLAEHVDYHNPAELADLVAAIGADRNVGQQVLEALDVRERLRLALESLKNDLEMHKIRANIAKEVEKNFQDTQRKHYLKEQLHLIQKELGVQQSQKDSLMQTYAERLEHLDVPDNVAKVIAEEMNKLASLEPAASEFNLTRTYLDWLTTLPWCVYQKESLNVSRARRILDADHYGLKDVKERILEFIAVGNLLGGVQGKIILLVGPPGVGKTSIGRSIARAIDREFFRFSVGGMADVSEIKGHRRTYVGAMPGKVIQALKSLKSSNPLVLIDEIDKLGKGFTGDPASALLEVLDPQQNSSFLDHYLDVPFDLSKVLFIATANVTDTIPTPLLDRMEVIRLSGYTTAEKVVIAQKYLIPKALKEAGLDTSSVVFRKGAIQELAVSYCRESGVRNMEKHVEKICRKIAYERVVATEASQRNERSRKRKSSQSSAKEPVEDAEVVAPETAQDKDATTAPVKRVTITKASLSKYVGKPVFNNERYYEKLDPGVVMGLAWTSMGGANLYIETIVNRLGKDGVQVTGQLGDVMLESKDIAYTYAKHFWEMIRPGDRYFENNTMHMHIPEGATPKDGPSAGVTMVTSLLSLALNEPVTENVAMTGELTLTGRVLPVGGIKEKVIAAKRAGVKDVIVPAENEKDWDDLDSDIRSGIKVHFAKWYVDVYRVAFPRSAPQPVGK